MPNRDIVVIGASAGGVSALKRLCVLLPADLDASVFVVLHIGNRASELDAILTRAGALPAEFARDDQPFQRGRVYLAPPDRHLLLRDGRTHLRSGARENMARPAIDPLFRSAAVCCGRRVIGVVLSGALGDGSVGLRAIKQCGGVGLVQDPQEAEFSEMPENAIAWGAPDHVAPLGELAQMLIRHTRESVEPEPAVCPDDIRMEAEIAFGLDQGDAMHEVPGTRSVFSCPECSGALWEIKEGDLVRYRCHVGHAFSAESMVEANGDHLERALWTALRILEERVELVRGMARVAQAAGRSLTAQRYQMRVREFEEQGELIRGLMRQARAPKAGAQAKQAAGR